MTASDILALVAAIIAGIALLRSWWAGREAANATREANDLSKQQVALQERITSIEESREQARVREALKANLRAELRRTGQNSWRLFIQNTGSSPARNVTITLDGQPILEHEIIPRGEQETKLIGPQSEVSFLTAVTMDCDPPFEFEVTWDDDSGEQGLFATTLTLT